MLTDKFRIDFCSQWFISILRMCTLAEQRVFVSGQGFAAEAVL